MTWWNKQKTATKKVDFNSMTSIVITNVIDIKRTVKI